MKIEDHMAASFLADGSYGEGISYLEFDLETLGPLLWALERGFGQLVLGPHARDSGIAVSTPYPCGPDPRELRHG